MLSPKRKKAFVIAVIAGIAIAAALLGLSYLTRVNRYQNQLRHVTFSPVDISALPDGEFLGAYDADLVGAKVSVTVKDGAVTEIRLLEHKQERGAAAERITEDIIGQQRIDVDAVTGATNSSRVIQKAVEDALLQAAESNSSLHNIPPSPTRRST